MNIFGTHPDCCLYPMYLVFIVQNFFNFGNWCHCFIMIAYHLGLKTANFWSHLCFLCIWDMQIRSPVLYKMLILIYSTQSTNYTGCFIVGAPVRFNSHQSWEGTSLTFCAASFWRFPVGLYDVDSVWITAINKGRFYSKIWSLGFSHRANGANQAMVWVPNTGKALWILLFFS